jgi:hypothetical protein
MPRLAFAAVCLALAGCSDQQAATVPPAPPVTSTQAASPPPETARTDTVPAASPLPGLPDWTAGYDSWIRLNGEPLPPRENDPHNGTKNVYSDQHMTDELLFPVGTRVIKEGIRPGADFVGLIATMRKLQGRNPEFNDWVFVEYTRESAEEPFTELARGNVCESCHMQVAQLDYVFTPSGIWP